ncbi:hypothetical protein VE03_10393 [Pseudogymnoascus sp. 23342-1-I1]|nr:hypothetical protein VE03_10393 [Pseudogymnoascus sp. 23342-1-I1]
MTGMDEDTIIVQRGRPVTQPPIMEEDNDQDEVDRQLQANTESNTQRGANTISRRSERIQSANAARQHCRKLRRQLSNDRKKPSGNNAATARRSPRQAYFVTATLKCPKYSACVVS